MNEMKEAYIGNCTILGYVKKNKWKNKKVIRIFCIQVAIFMFSILFLYINSNNYNIIETIKFISIELVIQLSFFILFRMRIILLSIPNLSFKLKWYQFVSKEIKEYFKTKQRNFFDKEFLMENSELDINKLDMVIDWAKESELRYRYSSAFEKALLAGLILPVWYNSVDYFFQTLNHTESQTVGGIIAIGILLLLTFFFIIFFLKVTVGQTYVELRNYISEEFKSFRFAMMEYKYIQSCNSNQNKMI